ncbi:MAG: acyltransferase [Lachnospiraceae bacterium]|nr:acyltransferase [Lachnospiraceae bacterium]
MIKRLSERISAVLARNRSIRYRRNLIEKLNASGAHFSEEGLKITATSRIYPGDHLTIGSGLSMNENCVINACDSHGIYIGNNLLLAPDVYIRAGNHDYTFSEEPFQKRGHCAKRVEKDGELYSIVIEDNVWIGRGASILSGAYIGKGSVIGAGSVVKEKIPEYSIVIGNPAKVVSDRRKYENFDGREDIDLFR